MTTYQGATTGNPTQVRFKPRGQEAPSGGSAASRLQPLTFVRPTQRPTDAPRRDKP